MTEFERIRAELERWPQGSGVSPSTLLEVEEPLRSILKRIMREGSMDFAELTGLLGLSESEAAEIAELMVTSGLLTSDTAEEGGATLYRLQRARTHRPAAPRAIWNRLLDDGDEGDA